jgi:hypothetical protein
MVTAQNPLQAVRDALGSSLFEMVAGPDGPAERVRIHHTPGPRWFAEGRPIRRVHADASMFVGGLRALLLQSLHPLAMAGVAEHSNYRDDPWGRLQRTSTFLAETTFGSAVDAQRAVDHVRGIHRRVHGIAADGRSYTATDPHLLEWVHVAEADSFLRAYQLYGAACDVAVVGSRTAVAALLSASGTHGRAQRRPCSGRRHPVGVADPRYQRRPLTMSTNNR